MKPSSYYEHLVNRMKKLYKFILLARDRSDYLTNQYSERKEKMLKLAETLVLTAMHSELSQDETKDDLK